MKAIEKDEIDLQRTVAEMRKLNEETAKLQEESRHLRKKNNYFEVMLIIAAFAAGGAFVKFLSL